MSPPVHSATSDLLQFVARVSDRPLVSIRDLKPLRSRIFGKILFLLGVPNGRCSIFRHTPCTTTVIPCGHIAPGFMMHGWLSSGAHPMTSLRCATNVENLPMATHNPPREPHQARIGLFGITGLGPNFGQSKLVSGLIPSPPALMGATPLADADSIYGKRRFTAVLVPRLWFTFDFRGGNSVHFHFTEVGILSYLRCKCREILKTKPTSLKRR